jgi:hypothetical protein
MEIINVHVVLSSTFCPSFVKNCRPLLHASLAAVSPARRRQRWQGGGAVDRVTLGMVRAPRPSSPGAPGVLAVCPVRPSLLHLRDASGRPASSGSRGLPPLPARALLWLCSGTAREIPPSITNTTNNKDTTTRRRRQRQRQQPSGESQGTSSRWPRPGGRPGGAFGVMGCRGGLRLASKSDASPPQ